MEPDFRGAGAKLLLAGVEAVLVRLGGVRPGTRFCGKIKRGVAKAADLRKIRANSVRQPTKRAQSDM